MPTLEDVAKIAGVSTATVSKVLSNTPYFTEATKQKVMQAVDELGYVPNLAARALSMGKTRIIAVVFPYVYEAIFTDPHIMHVLAGIEEECSGRGYNLLLSTPKLGSDNTDPHYIQLIQSGYLDGVLAVDSYPQAMALAPVLEKGIPAVSIGHGEYDYCARHDDQIGGQIIFEHLCQLGHRRIGIINVPEEDNYGIEYRIRGIRTACDAIGIAYDTLPSCYGNWSIDSGARCAKQLLTQHPDLTALMCMNDRMALGAIQQATEMGYNVPMDLTITGYDDIPMAAVASPPLTTVNQRAPEQGRLGAQMLFDILDGKPVESVILPPVLVKRGSSRHLSHS